MDISDKRFNELRALSKAITVQNNILERSKLNDINFQLGIQKVSEPFLKDVIQKEDEIIEKLNEKPKLKPKLIKEVQVETNRKEAEVTDVDVKVGDLIDINNQPPQYNEAELYSTLIPITPTFKFKESSGVSIKPISVMVEKYKYRFSGVSINNTSFFFYKLNNINYIAHEIDVSQSCPLTDGLIILLEGRGLLKLAKDDVTQDDLNNYFSIINTANVNYENIDYLTTLNNGGMGKGKDGKGLDLSDDDDLPDNPISLLTELRKHLAAKLAGHNNVYNTVKNILDKLLSIKEINQTKYDKIIKKYF